MTNINPLSEADIRTFLEQEEDWRFEENRLKTAVTVDSFETAIEVISEMAVVASKMDHHPFLTNVYNQLSFALCTHHVGDKVTEKDLLLAKEISRIIRQKKKNSE